MSLEAFLREHAMERYSQNFIEQGITDVEDLIDLPPTTLDTITTNVGMLKGHAIKFKRKLDDLKNQPSSSQTAAPVQQNITPQESHAHQYTESQDNYTPPPQQTYTPQPQQAYTPPPQQTYTPPPQQAYTPPPQQTYTPPPQNYTPQVQQNKPPVQQVHQSQDDGAYLKEISNTGALRQNFGTVKLRLGEIEKLRADLQIVTEEIMNVDVEKYRGMLNEIEAIQHQLAQAFNHV